MTEDEDKDVCGMPEAMLRLGGVALLLIVFFVGLVVITNG